MVASVGAFATLTTASFLPRVQTRTWYFMMLVQSGLGLGVGTIWTLHFIGMRATSLLGEAHVFAFDTGLTGISAISPWICSTLSIHLLQHPSAECKDTRCFFATMRRFWKFFYAAVLIAFGIGSMHYLGACAERGRFMISVDTGEASLLKFCDAWNVKHFHSSFS
eukprot:Skav224234  [mRNA]  locus=scaffold939:1251034:1251528:+ [translate_table: standard]